MADRSIQQMIDDVKRNTSTLISDTSTLAKEELKTEATKVGIGTGLFGGAAVLVTIATILLAIVIGFALMALGLPAWLAFLIDALLFILIAAVLVFFGIRQFKSITPPERTIAAVSTTLQVISESISPTPAESLDDFGSQVS